MTWLRARTRKLSLLALFALAIQFGLSFGHVHHERALFGKSAIFASVASPVSPDSGNDTDNRTDQCAICATIAIANALIGSLPPVLQLPAIVAATEILPVAVTHDATVYSLGFRSRAPPQS
ncbi:MAG: DUF2946 domain-containing protein [Afipia sp.]|nr:DUF2946 domain-containing protein [Afipia sp.]